jgi:hypothetical protein
MMLLLSLLFACSGDTHQKVITRTETVTTHQPDTAETVPTSDTPCGRRDPGVICTLIGVPHFAGFSAAPVPADETTLYLPQDVAFDPSNDAVFVADFNNHVIRELDRDGVVSTVVGTGFIGDGVDGGAGFDEGAGASFDLHHPTQLAFDPSDADSVYIAAWENHRIDRYRLSTGDVDYFAGVGVGGYDGDGGPADNAAFDLASSVAFGDDGTAYVMDQGNQVIRRVDVDGIVSTYAGTPGAYGHGGDGGPASEASFAALDWPLPSNQLVAHEGALFVVDTGNQVIREIDLATDQITTVVGRYVQDPIGLDTDGDGVGDEFYGAGGYAGDGGAALDARLNSPRDIAFGPDGSMYVADTNNHCVRRVDPEGTIDVFAGECGVPTAIDGDLLDGGDPLDATLFAPTGVDVDPEGNVYIADTNDQVIRVVWSGR